MASIRVVSRRKVGVKPMAGELVVPIDRGSMLGNPHRMAYEAQRAEVILCFREDLVRDWRSNGPMRKEIERIAEIVRSGQDVALACWCAPKRCHGDVIKRAIEALLA